MGRASSPAFGLPAELFFTGQEPFRPTALGVRIEVTMAEPVIVIDPEVMSGTPCFRGTRVPFKNLIDYLEGGHSLGEFLRSFPRSRVKWPSRRLRKQRIRCSLRIG